jgi:hypothetical protein
MHTRRHAFLALAFLVLSVLGAAAQDMALRFYVVPKIGTGAFTDPFRPKYITEVGSPWNAMDYGLEDTMLAGINVTSAQHTTLQANIDVISIPADLDSQIGLSALSTVQSRLEGLLIPADWVTTSHTYRDVLRIVGKAFMFMQRFHVRQVRRFFESGVTLETRVNQLTQAQRAAMEDAAFSLGLDISGITGPMKLRQALRMLWVQMPSFTLMGETF